MTDLATLPAPQIIEPLDFEQILADLKADILDRAPELAEVLALESDPIVKLLEACAYRELLYRARVNDAARAHLLAFATGGDLDHLAAQYGVTRQDGEADALFRTVRYDDLLGSVLQRVVAFEFGYDELTKLGYVKGTAGTKDIFRLDTIKGLEKQ